MTQVLASTPWKSLGLKPRYETEELIVLRSTNPEAMIPADSKLRLEGPLPQGHSLILSPRVGSDNQAFYEFYALRAGTYSLKASWMDESAQVQILPRESLGFQMEFGIFVVIAGALVLGLALKFLFRKNSSRISL